MHHENLHLKQGTSRLRHAHPEAGLSLVEVMVTLSIVAIATSLIVLTLPRAQPQKQAVGLLREALERTAERAMITGQPSGMVFEQGRYSPAIWQDETWRLIGGQNLPAGMTILIDGETLRAAEASEAPVPAVIFDPLGHTQPVAIDLVRNDFVTRLTLGADGKVAVDMPS